MSNTKRPSAARRHTRTTEAERKSALDTGYRFTIEGEVFEARMGDVTPAVARELRANIGTGFQGLLHALATDPDIDVISAAVWVARRLKGEYVAFDEVAVTYGDMLSDGFEIAEPGAEDVDGADPEG